MSPELTDVLAFVRVVETGGFARAAERLGVSKSIVSRRVGRLEQTLSARLLTRTARGAMPTDIGAAYYARLSAILGELEAAHEAVAEAVSEIAGMIRIAAPQSFGVLHLAPALAAFMALHPRVELDLSFDDRVVDLVGGGFDLAVRLGSLPSSSLVARRLAPMRLVVVGSPDYFAANGRPRHPRELAGHQILAYANAGAAEQWRFRIDDRWEAIRVGGRLRADSGEMLREAAVAGLGIAILPTFIASPALTTGALETILSDFSLESGGVYAVLPPGRGVTARVRALVDFLVARFGPEPVWDPCWQAEQGRR